MRSFSCLSTTLLLEIFSSRGCVGLPYKDFQPRCNAHRLYTLETQKPQRKKNSDQGFVNMSPVTSVQILGGHIFSASHH